MGIKLIYTDEIFQGKCLENRIWSTKESQHLGAERRKRKPQDILRITSLKIGNNPGKSGAVEENIGRRYFLNAAISKI